MIPLSAIFKGKNNNLTFLRLIAALMVIYGHTNAILPNTAPDWIAKTTGCIFAGKVAIDFFFLLSGFLVTASILNNGIRHYIAGRFLRIYPALWFNLFLITFVLGTCVTTLSIHDYLTNKTTWSYFFRLASTFKETLFLPGVFTINHNQAVNGPLWSILLEVRLYVFILIAYLLRILQSRTLFNCIFFTSLILLGTNSHWALALFNNNITNQHVCLMFYIGAFLYINRDLIPVSPYYLLVALIFGAATLGSDHFLFAYLFIMITLFCTISFYPQFSWLDKYGDYSYGIYLYG